jgi:GDP/UDP-N,N'-diacetylbacillosamine 2-epimerase (hydrolysing)
MGRFGMKNIYLLSSTRADYSIYYPLMVALRVEQSIRLRIVAFGTHLEQQFGYTLSIFEKDGFEVYSAISTYSEDDSPAGISKSIAKTMSSFSDFWEAERQTVDLIIALGDRYEMFAAVAATVPFQLPVAHLHGGETTLGAIDNVYRHSISLYSKLHFAATPGAAARLKLLLGYDQGVFYTGALAIDTIQSIQLLNLQMVKDKFQVDLGIPTILFTYHPETVDFEENENNTRVLLEVLEQSGYQIVITLPNADTYGNTVRTIIKEFCKAKQPPFFVFETMGAVGYYSAMKFCSFVMGNSSSGILEAASFGKYAINVGDRQKGREAGNNVIHLPIEKEQLQRQIEAMGSLPDPGTLNIYGEGKATPKIMKYILNFLSELK